MKSRRRNERRLMPAEQLFADDFQTAEVIFGKPTRKKTDRKVHQLCRQVERAISLALAGECRDDVLRELMVESVTPAPDASRLMVTLSMTSSLVPGIVLDGGLSVAPSDGGAVADVITRLERARGLIRHAVASAITRKRAPELIFRIINAGEVRP